MDVMLWITKPATFCMIYPTTSGLSSALIRETVEIKNETIVMESPIEVRCPNKYFRFEYYDRLVYDTN